MTGQDECLLVSIQPTTFYYGSIDMYQGKPNTYDRVYTPGVDPDLYDFWDDTDMRSMRCDPSKHRIIYIDDLDHEIKVLSNFYCKDTTSAKRETIHQGVSDTSHARLAYDWLTGNMYWSDNQYNWVAMQNVDKSDVTSPSYRSVLHEGVVAPGAIAIDPLKRYMYDPYSTLIMNTM